MSNFQIVTLVLIFSGGVIIGLSAAYTHNLINKLKIGKYKPRWKVLFGLMLLFSLGYFIVVGIIIAGNISTVYTVTGLIFFFGALFVYLTVWTGLNTIEDLLETTVSKDYVENIIRSMADTLIVIDADKESTIRTVNQATVNLLGYDEEELVGVSIGKIIDPEILNKLKTDMLSKGKTFLSIETTYKTKSGKDIPVSLSATLLKKSKGEPEGVIYVARDIREQKEAERKINEYLEQLKQLNASKDRFFSIIAHDLKNPFTGVLGAAEILASDAGEMEREEIKEFANALYKQTKSIYDLLENLLEWSRIQTGRIKYSPTNCNVADCVNKVLNIYESLADKKGVKISYNGSNNIKVFADENMMDTVLRNLLSNAIKFTPEGGKVTIDVKDTGNEYVEVSVADNGVGIPEAVQEKLFKIDEQVTTTGTNDETGTGLGLILCKELVEKNGGKLTLKSKPGEGTTFTFTLPKSQVN